jgi:hypothetical protein
MQQKQQLRQQPRARPQSAKPRLVGEHTAVKNASSALAKDAPNSKQNTGQEAAGGWQGSWEAQARLLKVPMSRFSQARTAYCSHRNVAMLHFFDTVEYCQQKAPAVVLQWQQLVCISAQYKVSGHSATACTNNSCILTALCSLSQFLTLFLSPFASSVTQEELAAAAAERRSATALTARLERELLLQGKLMEAALEGV